MSFSASIIALALAGSAPATAEEFRQRPPEDEIVYFLLPDRFENGDPKNDKGGVEGDRLATGFDPAGKGFFHGGDLKGLKQRLDGQECPAAHGAVQLSAPPEFRLPRHGDASDHVHGAAEFRHYRVHLARAFREHCVSVPGGGLHRVVHLTPPPSDDTLTPQVAHASHEDAAGLLASRRLVQALRVQVWRERRALLAAVDAGHALRHDFRVAVRAAVRASHDGVPGEAFLKAQAGPLNAGLVHAFSLVSMYALMNSEATWGTIALPIPLSTPFRQRRAAFRMAPTSPSGTTPIRSSLERSSSTLLGSP